MKTLYGNTIKACSFLFIIVMMISCSTSLTYQDAVSKNERKIDDPARLSDARFLVEAKSFNMLQTRLTETAITSGYSSKVVDMARKQLDELRDMDEDLETLARKEKMTLPDIMSNEHLALANEVNNTGREDFDRDFIITMQRINDENKEQYLNMATEAKDADVRAFSARKLDLLRSQATRMSETEKQLMNTY